MIYRSLELNSVTNAIFNFQSQIGAILVFSCKCVRRLHSISSLFSVVFLCLILPTQEFILEKSAKITKNEVSQDLMRFWSYEPLVETILLRWHFVNSSELRFDFVCFGAIKAWQRNLKKRMLIPILCMFSCLVSIHSKMWILHPSLK